MQFLKEFVSKGTRTELLSTANPLTPPAWISTITGRSPGNHGFLTSYGLRNVKGMFSLLYITFVI